MDHRGCGRCIGIVQVPLANLHFIEGLGERTYNQTHTNNLEELFRCTSINHNDRRHWIDGYVDSSDEELVLRDLDTSRSQLNERNLRGEYPYIQRNVIYTHGRHRVEAAKSIDPSSCWTVRLYVTDQRSLSTNPFIKSRTEQYQHELKYSDGHIYSKLREYTESQLSYREWHERLSTTKQKAFLYITKRPAICNALDELLPLKGALEFLQLSSFLKIFDQRLDNELLAGLKYLNTQWSRIAGGNKLILGAFDRDSLAVLEGQAPTVCNTERLWITSSFVDGQTFPSITNTDVRRGVEQRVLETPGLVHGLRSLHSNMQYLCICAEIIWSYLLPKELRLSAKSKQMSLSETLLGCWTRTDPYVETCEGVFQPAFGPPSFNLAYTQLMLSALRLFPYLTDAKPKVERGEKVFLSIDLHCVAAFHKRAKILGFRTLDFDLASMDSMLHVSRGQWSLPDNPQRPDEAELLKRPDHRWGRPYKEIFRVIQTQAFLPTIKNSTKASNLCVAFVLSELLAVYLPPYSFELDHSRAPICIQDESMTQHPAGQQRIYPNSTLEPIIEEEETVDCDGDQHEPFGTPDCDIPMNDIESVSKVIEENCTHNTIRNTSKKSCSKVRGVYGHDTSMRPAENLLDIRRQVNVTSPVSTEYMSEDNSDSDICMTDVDVQEKQSQYHSDSIVDVISKTHGDSTPIAAPPSSTLGPSCLDVLRTRLGSSVAQDEEHILHRPRCRVSSVPGSIETWRQQLSPTGGFENGLDELSTPIYYTENNIPQVAISSPASRSTILSLPSSGYASTASRSGAEQRRISTSIKDRRRNRRTSRNRHVTRHSPVPIQSVLGSDHSRSTIIDQYQLSQDCPSWDETFGSTGVAAFGETHVRPGDFTERRENYSQRYDIDQQNFWKLAPDNRRELSTLARSLSTPPRSLLVTNSSDNCNTLGNNLLPPSRSSMASGSQQSRLSGGQRLSNWPGFIESDDDLVSIDL